MLPEHALPSYKKLIVEAAKLTRSEVNDKHRNAKHLLIPNLTLISRLVVPNNVHLARMLVMRHEFFAKRIVFRFGRVHLVDPAAFALEMREAKSKQHAHVMEHETCKPKA